MFSVDNFYDVFHANYGLEKTGNFVMTFRPHGSKDLHNLEPFGKDIPSFNNPSELGDKADIWFNSGRIIMHDQEPFFLDYVDTYKHNILEQKKPDYIQDQRQQLLNFQLSKKAEKLSRVDFMKYAIGGRPPPIICHSELHSKDIQQLEMHGFVSCYYWWHGMIARDWFRHWQQWPILQVRDKSKSPKRFLLYARATDGTRSYRKDLIEHCRRHRDLISFNWEGELVTSDFSAMITPEDAHSPIHLVAETLFDTTKIYITEKIFKPIVMSQCFLVFGPPGTLAYLKRYGFKTFDCCWSEAYDTVGNAQHRMAILNRLIDSLAALSDHEMQALYEKALPVIAHNRARFFSSEFQDDLIQEMHQNMELALFKQNQSH